MTRAALRLLSFFLLVILAIDYANAARVNQVKGKKVLIQLEGLNVQAGSELFAINSEQKRKAVIRISAVKDDRAVGEVVQGNAVDGMLLIVKNSSPSPTTPPPSFSDATANDRNLERDILKKKRKQGFGLLAGFAMTQASLTAKTRVSSTTYEDSLALKGNSFNFKAIYDYQMSQAFTIRGAVGLETINTTATPSSGKEAVCSNSSSCTLGLNYLGFEGSAQFNLTNSSSLRYWIGAGYAFLMAMSKSNNISNLEATSTNQVLFASTGADISVGNKGYIPLVVEYGLFPFAGIQLSGIYLRGGYGWRF